MIKPSSESVGRGSLNLIADAQKSGSQYLKTLVTEADKTLDTAPEIEAQTIGPRGDQNLKRC